MVENYEEVLSNINEIVLDKITLRRFTTEDKEDVFEYASDSDVLRYLLWDGVRNIEEAEKAINEYYIPRYEVFAIQLNETGKCIGCIDLRMKPEHEKAGFGYALNKKYWNNGYMTEALGAVLQMCFDKLELNRVEALHYVGNEGSGRVMQKCGMKKEGVGIRESKVKGVFRDLVHYGIVKDDFRI